MSRPGAWRQSPGTSTSDPIGRAAVEIIAFVMATVGPLTRSVVLPASRPDLVLLAAVVFSAGMSLLGSRWLLRLVLATVAGLLLLPTQGELIAIWLSLGLLLADWVARRRRPVPHVPPASRGSLGPTSVIMTLAAVLGLWMSATWQPLAAVLLAGATAAVITLFGGWLEQQGLRAGHGLRRLLWWTVLALPWLFTVVLPWTVNLLSRAGSSADDRPGWARRHGLEVRPSQTWSKPATSSADRAAAFRPMLTACLAAAVLVAPLAILARGRSAAPPPPPVPAAFEDDGWYAEYVEDTGWASQEEVAWRVFRDRRMLDVATRHMTIRDGVRASWRPPPCECQVLTVWLYGGSTTFGLGQRDDHTIPSALARAAWADGIVLDVVNRGVPGHAHWTEADRFAWDLTVEDAPDLVLFYDGVNELWSTVSLYDPELNEDWIAVEPNTELILRDQRPGGRPPLPPEGARVVPIRPVGSRLEEDVGELAAQRFARSTEMSKATAAARNIPVRWFWQPSRGARPTIPAEPHHDAQGEKALRTQYRSARAALPDHVADLTDVFLGDREPYFWDDLHHNEDAAAIIGLAMFRELRPTLLNLTGSEG